MKILVTGGAGFIGSNIVDRYIEEGHEVVVLDNLSTGSKKFINKKAKFYQLDIVSKEVKSVLKKEKPDIVNHHAAQIDIRKSVSDPVFDAEVNIVGSLNVLQNCIESGVKKVIFASSGGAVYGEPEYLPAPETHRVQPLSPYGVAKLTIENYLIAMRSYSGKLDYTILRYANVFGPRQNLLGEAGVCSIFLGKMKNDEDCILYGYGDAIRDYVYVGDVAEANVLALNKGSCGCYNIGTGVGSKVKEVYDVIKDFTGYKKEPKLEQLRAGELKQIYLDYSKAQKELGWGPKVSLREGLKKLVESEIN
jgi:UDP-glucose 4-epimerase